MQERHKLIQALAGAMALYREMAVSAWSLVPRSPARPSVARPAPLEARPA